MTGRSKAKGRNAIRSVFVTTYVDNGQTRASVYWGDGSITDGDVANPHMQALIDRARRQKVRVRYGEVGGILTR